MAFKVLRFFLLIDHKVSKDDIFDQASTF